MPATYASPDNRNYAVFKGNAYFTPAGGARRHLGNCTAFGTELAVEKLDHFSAMAGIRSKDRSVAIQQTLTLSVTLEEMTLANLQMALFGGEAEENTDGDWGFDIGAVTDVVGAIELVGSNTVGPKLTYEYPEVTFTPNGSVEAIGEADWASIALTGDVSFLNGKFGRLTVQDSAGTDVTP